MGNNIFQRNSVSVSCSSNSTPCQVVKMAFIIKPKFCITIQEGKAENKNLVHNIITGSSCTWDHPYPVCRGNMLQCVTDPV